MGRRTYADNCTNVARVGDTPLFAEHRETVAEAEDRGAGPFDPAYVFNGWRVHRGGDVPYKGSLFPESYLGPNGEVAHVLNSHRYAPEGVYDWAVFGPDPEHVRAFLRAFGFEGVRIVEAAVVMQTL